MQVMVFNAQSTRFGPLSLFVLSIVRGTALVLTSLGAKRVTPTVCSAQTSGSEIGTLSSSPGPQETRMYASTAFWTAASFTKTIKASMVTKERVSAFTMLHEKCGTIAGSPIAASFSSLKAICWTAPWF